MGYKLVCFDLDGCLTEKDDSWSFIHRNLGVWEDAKKHRKLFFSGKITYQEWADLDVGLWKGTHRKYLEEIIQQIKLRPNIETVVQKLKEKNLILIIISSGLSFFADRIKEEYNFDFSIANSPIVDESGLLTGECHTTVRYDDKHLVLHTILENHFKDHTILLKECIAIGDGENDVPLFNEVGFSIAFNPIEESVAKAADKVVVSGDLLDVLNIILELL